MGEIKATCLMLCLFVTAPEVLADTHYVSPTGGNRSPYTSWSNAATSVASAIAQAASGDSVYVTNGTYVLSSQITLYGNITVKSVNGPLVTVLDGNNAVRVAYLNNANAVLRGFTICNGYANVSFDKSGSGVMIEDGGYVEQCVIRNNKCWVNAVPVGMGGGVCIIGQGVVRNCLIRNNSASCSASMGGSTVRGGGVEVLSSPNSAASVPAIDSCTIVDNYAGTSGGGLHVGTAAVVRNSIIYGNTSGVSYPEWSYSATLTFTNCCSSSLPPGGAGNITIAPLFVASGSGDYHLGVGSPCVNAGAINSVNTTNDLDGRPRIINGRIDIGAYEDTSVTVTFDAQGGSASPSMTNVNYNSAYGPLPPPTRTGYTSGGWWTGAGGAGTHITSATIVTVADAHTLYAAWTANNYTVTFDAQGGSVSPGTTNVAYNSVYGTLPTPARTGYAFGGWWTGVDGIGIQVTAGTTVTITAAQTLYAKWTAYLYTVTFDAKGGSVSPGTTSVTFNSTYGTLPNPTRTGYTSGGWWTGAGGIGEQVTFATTVTVASAHTLYAKWTANTYVLTVSTLYAAAIPPVGSNQFSYGSSVDAAITNSPVAFGVATQFLCTGWAMIGNEPSSGTGTSFTATITNDAMLTWCWQTNVWLAASARKHGSVEGAGWCVLGTSTNIAAVPDAGHQFTGWLGDVPVGQTHNNPLTLTMDRSRVVEATFFTEYHVAAAGGNDANSGLSTGAAKQTIQAALDETANGDTVMVSNGLYGAITVTNGVRVESVNGADETIIGSMAAGSRAVYLVSNAVLSGFTVTGAVTDVNGAGVYAEPGAQVDRCIIRGNRTSRDGGGVYGGSLTNCLLTGNSASNGAGAANASLTYSTVVGNSATDSGGGTKDCTLLNSIVYDNVPDNHIGSTANYTCATPLLTGTGNFTNDPYFVDVLIGDYRLSYTSPCLGSASSGINVDLGGTPRPQPKVYGGASGYDMGCYEYYPKACFVWANGKGIPPYDSWVNAATSIQAAVDNAAGGDLVMVEAGTYAPFTISKAVTLMSLRGPTNTVVDGGGIARPITITAPAVLDGFTVQNGADDDCGGILADNGATIRNVLIINNSALAPGGMGGGMCLYNGSSAERVTVVSNQAQYGAGIYAASTSTVSSSTITWNTSPSGEGGGIYLKDSSAITESTISSNSSARGGGVYADSSQVSYCTVQSNTASEYGGGIAQIGGTLNNSWIENNKSWNGGGIYALNSFSHSCVVASNFAASRGGGVYLNGIGLACNLTVANNQATTAGGGVWINGTSKLWNSIVMYNVSSNVAAGSGDIRYCCIDPLMAGQGNINTNPLFVGGSDYHLRALSLCLDAGTNLAWMTGAKDIDREARVWPDWSDLGADEAVVGAGEMGRDDGLFVKWNVVVGARLQIQTTTNLMESMWADFGGVVTASQARMTMSWTNDAPMGFFRMIWLKP